MKFKLDDDNNAIFVKDGSERMRAVNTYTKLIKVATVQAPFGETVKAFIAKNWQWAWGAILIPLAGWLIAGWRKKKAAKTESEPADGEEAKP